MQAANKGKERKAADQGYDPAIIALERLEENGSLADPDAE